MDKQFIIHKYLNVFKGRLVCRLRQLRQLDPYQNAQTNRYRTLSPPLHVLRCGLPSNLVLTCQLFAYLRKMINLFFERVTCPDDQVMTFYLASITNKINVVLKLLTFLKEFQVVQEL